MNTTTNEEYAKSRDKLIPEAQKMAKRVVQKLAEGDPKKASFAFARVFSSAMDTLAFNAGLTSIKPMKPFDFWEQESKRWKDCGKALQT